MSGNYLTKVDGAIAACLTYEADGDNPPDGRRVVRERRLQVQAALQMRPIDAAAVTQAAERAIEVLGMWR